MNHQPNGTWHSFKHGLQVGSGFFVGYFLMRFLSLVAMIVVGFIVIVSVCVPVCAKHESTLIAPVEQAMGVNLINPPRKVWPTGCRVRSRPSRHARILGQVHPGKAYTVLDEKRGWVKIGGFRRKGWVGCKGYAPGMVPLRYRTAR